jgi:hypothetical protein
MANIEPTTTNTPNTGESKAGTSGIWANANANEDSHG